MLSGPRAVGGPSATVLAFDGLVADTLPARASALGAALSALSALSPLPADVMRTGLEETLRAAIAGRTFAEAARLLLAAPHVAGVESLATTTNRETANRETANRETADRETLVDLVAMDAGRRYTAALADGVSLCPGAVALVAELARAGRVVARADSVRRDVETVLAFAAIESGFTFVRCSDDLPRAPGLSSLEGSWRAIDRRLRASGVDIEQRVAMEVGAAADAARPFVAEVRASRFEGSG